MSPARVLHVANLGQLHLRRWCELAEAAGCEVEIAGSARSGVDGDPPAGRPVHPAPFATGLGSNRVAALSGSRSRLRLARSLYWAELGIWALWLRRLVHARRPDLVHAHTLTGWGAAAALGGVRPLVVSVWGSDAYTSAGAGARVAWWTARRAGEVTAPSPDLVARAAERGVRARHVDLGVDLDRFRPRDAAWRTAERRRMGLGEGPVVASFRAATPVYRPLAVLAAFEQLLERRPDAQLVLAHGPLPLPEEAVGKVERLSRRATVVDLGDVPHERMPAVLAAADVGVSLARSDGSPRSVWECLACGTPVVLADLPQLRDRIGDDRGVLHVEPCPSAVADALLGAIEDPLYRKAAEGAGRAWVKRNVAFGEQVRGLEEAYAAALAAPPSCAPRRARR